MLTVPIPLDILDDIITSSKPWPVETVEKPSALYLVFGPHLRRTFSGRASRFYIHKVVRANATSTESTRLDDYIVEIKNGKDSVEVPLVTRMENGYTQFGYRLDDAIEHRLSVREGENLLLDTTIRALEDGTGLARHCPSCNLELPSESSPERR